jgi:exodeoxyribonuclease VII large subunit
MTELQNILTISELTAQIRFHLEEKFNFVQVMGEISNFKIHHQSGHYYFTLKDENAQIQAVMWKARNLNLPFTPEDGMQVVVKGRITVYPGRGTYQVDVWEIKPQGIGELQLRFEKLKQKLLEEGLFDESHKMPIPEFPETLAVITSRTGAALQDFINIIRRRYPVLQLYIYPVIVQGKEAPPSVIEALKDIQNLSKKEIIPKIDIIVITRGGGSFEDLYPFNDEALAKAIFNCKIPIVSAVGHEVDYTICDFVADLRAPTPSAAAELITPDINQLIENIDKFSYFSRSFVQNKLINLQNSVKEVENSYYFKRPKDLINNYYQRLDELSKKLDSDLKEKLKFLKSHLDHIGKTLFHINPVNNLKKGYTLIRHYKQPALFENADKGKIIPRASMLKKEDDVEIEFYDKKLPARIK